MPNQSSAAVIAAIKRETTFGTAAAAGAGGFVLPIIDSPGMEMQRGRIASGRRRRDLIRAMGRLGAKTGTGTFNTELLPGGAIDILMESLTRGTYTAVLAPAAISITNTATVITRASGSFITDGYRTGDIITFTGDTTTANNDLRLRVTIVTALAMTIASVPGLTAQAVARAVTITRTKKVMTPATPVNTSFSIEQNDSDIDESELFIGSRLVSAQMSFRPNEPVTCAWGFQAVDRQHILTASAPYFTNPTDLTGDSLIADDSWIRYKGADIVSLTGMELNFPIDAATQPTIGSIVSPDVFMNDMAPAGNIQAIRQSLAALDDFDAEIEFELQMTLLAPGANPRKFCSFYFPRVKIGAVTAPFLGGNTAKIETRELMFATYAGDTDTDATAFIYQTSEP